MENDHAIKLANLLLQRTKLKKIRWEEDPFEVGFFLSLDNGRCQVYSDSDDQVHFKIMNKSDVTLETIDQSDLTLELDFDAAALHELYNLARRNALDADKIIENMITEINEDQI